MKTASQDQFARRNLIFVVCGESYLIGRVHRNAQRASKIDHYLWKPDSYPLWRSLFASSFLDPHWTQERDCNRGTFCPTEQSLQHRGVIACNSLPDHSWFGTNRNHTAFATEWCLSVLERIADLPRPQHSQTFL